MKQRRIVLCKGMPLGSRSWSSVNQYRFQSLGARKLRSFVEIFGFKVWGLRTMQGYLLMLHLIARD